MTLGLKNRLADVGIARPKHHTDAKRGVSAQISGPRRAEAMAAHAALCCLRELEGPLFRPQALEVLEGWKV